MTKSLPETTCVSVTRDSDSITFKGKLTAAPTTVTATLKNGTTFIFIFGKEATVESTAQPTTKSSPATKIPNATQPVPLQQTTPSEESHDSENTADGGNEQETVPTTSSGKLETTPLTVFLLALFIPFLAQ